MPERINGAVTAHQNLTGSLQYYIVFVSSPGAFSDPNPNPDEIDEIARGVNIQATGDVSDQSQKNFEILFQSVALRAVPVIMNDPIAVSDLSAEGAPTLTGEGFIYKFSVERLYVFENSGPNGTIGPVGLLIDELDGVVLDSGVRVTTVDGSLSGFSKNIEFIRVDEL
jgi:hypothetical protein